VGLGLVAVAAAVDLLQVCWAVLHCQPAHWPQLAPLWCVTMGGS
jgi:hypothetical protein